MLLFAVSATAGNIAGVAAQAVTYGPNETSKSLSLTRGQLTPTLQVTARSEPMARVCDVPNGADAVRSFVAFISSRPAPLRQQQARGRLNALKGFGMTDAGEQQTATQINDETWSAIGFPGNREPRWWREGAARNLSISAAQVTALESGQSATVEVHSRCLTVPNFKSWLGEVVRVLEQYYQVTY